MGSRRAFVLGASALASGIGAPAALAQATVLAPSPAWAQARPETQGFPTGALDRLFETGSLVPALRALAVVRNGRLVGERHYAGTTPDDLLPIHSATKSIVSLLVGQAVAQGKLKSDLSQTVAELLPDLAARFPNAAAHGLTLRQILSGTTGLAYDYRLQARALSISADPAIYAMGLEADAQPPGHWSYNDAAIALLSPILERVQGLGLAALAQRDLFDALGIAHSAWQRDKTGRAFAHRGLSLRTADLAKVAWLVADGGRWNDRVVVPSRWIEDSTRAQTPGAWSIPPIGPTAYGYLWFTGRLHGTPVAWAWGYGGQFAFVAPALRLAIATAATDPGPRELQAQTTAMMALVAQAVALAG